MRGSHPGAFETAHSVRDGDFWAKAGKPVAIGETYDLIVVGGGISGLSAAYFYRKQAGPSARILILDNHDDFGGHAKRNEFRPGGRLLLTNGGTVAIESPFPYSKEASGLITELGIDPPAFEKKYSDDEAYRGLGSGYFFDKETFGTRAAGHGRARRTPQARRVGKWGEFLAKTPLSAQAQESIVRIQEDNTDYMKGVPQAEKKSPPLADELQGFPAQCSEGPPRCDSFLSVPHSRPLRNWHRRGPGARLLGHSLSWISRHGA